MQEAHERVVVSLDWHAVCVDIFAAPKWSVGRITPVVGVLEESINNFIAGY